MVKDTTLYDRLQVSVDANESAIKKSYFKLSKIWHPDKHQVQDQKERDEAAKKFQEIKEAYDILCDTNKRSLYDQIGMDILQQGQGQQGVDPFEHGFPFGAAGFPFMPFGMNQGKPRERIDPIVVDLTVTLEQICKEESVSITYPCFYSCLTCNGEGTLSGKPNLCSSCNGKGQQIKIMRTGNMIQQIVSECNECRGKGTVIDLSQSCKECFGEGKNKKQKTRMIPLQQGLDNGHKMNLQGKGHYLKYGARSDLIVSITISPHAQFKRYKNDLYTVVPLTLYQLLYGYKKYITLLNGRIIHIEHVGNTEPNSVKCIRNEGLKHIQTNERGSLYLLFHLQLPEVTVIPECKPLLESLDPTEVQKECEFILSEPRQTMFHDPISAHSIYYQLIQQDNEPKHQEQSHSSQHHGQHHGQPQCVQQ
jgi:DnaJ-class molecular chaperone